MMNQWINHALYCITEYEIALNNSDIEDALEWEEAAEAALTQAKLWEGFDCSDTDDLTELVDYQFGETYRIDCTIQ